MTVLHLWYVLVSNIDKHLIVAMIIQIRQIYLSKWKYRKSLKIHDESQINVKKIIWDI